MPELPDVEIYKQYVAATSLYRTIVDQNERIEVSGRSTHLCPRHQKVD